MELLVGRSDGPTPRNELHHRGWNACSSALKHENRNIDSTAPRPAGTAAGWTAVKAAAEPAFS